MKITILFNDGSKTILEGVSVYHTDNGLFKLVFKDAAVYNVNVKTIIYPWSVIKEATIDHGDRA
jgi:hypothetical protein